jgi:hypothetical protein
MSDIFTTKVQNMEITCENITIIFNTKCKVLGPWNVTADIYDRHTPRDKHSRVDVQFAGKN